MVSAVAQAGDDREEFIRRVSWDSMAAEVPVLACLRRQSGGGRSAAQLAHELGVPPATVRVMLRRADSWLAREQDRLRRAVGALSGAE